MKKIIILILLSQYSFSTLDYAELQLVKEAVFLAFEEIKPSSKDVLYINKAIPGLSETYWWDIDMIHASYVKVENDETNEVEHNIYLMGGFVRLDGMTPDGLAVTACHEIGHGIGGAPYKDPSMGSEGSSAEGQSDYFSTRVCLPIVMKYLNELREISPSETMMKLCTRQSEYETSLCNRMMVALESDMHFFEHLGTPVSFDEYSTVVATQINTDPSFYPDAQCRLDTMINGILGLERPKCWFPDGIENGILRD